MSFTSVSFIIFLCATLLLYYLVPKRAQWWVLLAASYIFYFAAGSWYLPFIIFTTLSSYAIARVMSNNLSREGEYLAEHRESMDKDARKAYKAGQKKKRFCVLLVGILLNFGILAVLKYTGFAISNVNLIIGAFGGTKLGIPSLILPLGISFYTFQTMGYLIDVYRGKTQAEKNPFRLALFVSFFPQLVQGPISRHSDLASQLYAPHRAEWGNIVPGMIRICWGFFKKLVVADTVMIVIKEIVSDTEKYGGAYVLFLIIAYSVEIYADFTGGIDITIGIGEAMGIKIAENFNRPFASTSTKEYWNRWHITMGSWFTDYVFYPLSITKSMQRLSKWSRAHLGNAVGKRVPVYTATIITWFLTGLWHGASWNFIVWGLLNCLVILVSQECQPLYNKLNKRFPRLVRSGFWTVYLRAQTFMIMGTIRVLDVYRNVPVTFKMLGTIFYDGSGWQSFLSGGFLSLGLDISAFAVIAVGILLMLAVSEISSRGDRPLKNRLADKPLLAFGCMAVLIFAILIFGSYGIGFDASQFIYTQF